MNNVELAQKNHERGLWSDEMLDKLVNAKKISKSESDVIKKNTISKTEK